jgi:hypothetical protein
MWVINLSPPLKNSGVKTALNLSPILFVYQ